MNLLNELTIKGLRSFVTEARNEAKIEARKQGKWIRSRGTYLTTGNTSGQCEPRPAADCPSWNGSKKEIDTLIAMVSEKYPDVTTIRIEGGFDCSDTFEQLFRNDDYLPMASWWEIEVWTREEVKS